MGGEVQVIIGGEKEDPASFQFDFGAGGGIDRAQSPEEGAPGQGIQACSEHRLPLYLLMSRVSIEPTVGGLPSGACEESEARQDRPVRQRAPADATDRRGTWRGWDSRTAPGHRAEAPPQAPSPA